jgi:hypothetical protein
MKTNATYKKGMSSTFSFPKKTFLSGVIKVTRKVMFFFLRNLYKLSILST